jgi:hypothetical protein
VAKTAPLPLLRTFAHDSPLSAIEHREQISNHPEPVTEDTNHPENFLRASFPGRYAGPMTTILRSGLFLLALSSVALAQSAPRKSQETKPQNAAASPAISRANGNEGQHDAAAGKNQASASHSGNLIGNHKDVMEAVDKNSNSGSHSGGMSGNHKDVMGTAAAPSAGGKNSPAAQPAAPSKPN